MTIKTPTIFIAIANYRDPEITATLNDCFAKAAQPEQIRVGVFTQRLPADENCQAPTHPQVDEVTVDALSSLGVCWARHQLYSQLLGDENFVLQIDSHMRFEPDWDMRLLAMWQQCQNPKAIISHYPPGYTPSDQLAEKQITVLKPGKFNANGVLVYQSDTYPYSQKPALPVPSAFVSGNFLFSPRDAIREVPYDPYLYFFGEEITLSARLWTHGWDFYAPDDVVAYHNYGKQTGRPRHWDDHHNVAELEALSVQRIQYLLAGKVPDNPEALKDLERYGLGNARSLADYEKLAKVDFKQQQILETRYVRDGRMMRIFKG